MSRQVPLLGIETEYGIIREDLETSDPVEESMELLRICQHPSVFQKWDYRKERTHLDMRGFTVNRLAQDEEEDEFCEEDRKRPYSYLDMKSDRVLTNGARFYNDHTHPEYGTPECANLFDLVAHDMAGEDIVRECVRLRNEEIGTDGLQLFKNNTDYSGHSYGTHDNYLIQRHLPFETWSNALLAFLVTRQLYAGAGKVGVEGDHPDGFIGLQLAQRSDFMEAIMNIETMTKRPIINTRDEPHADSSQYRRLHLILGDANMSSYATALKVGTTRQVLRLIGEEKLTSFPELADPVKDCRTVSRDLSGKTLLNQKQSGTITPLEIQRAYLEQVAQHPPSDEENEKVEYDWVVREWGRTLDDLDKDSDQLDDRIDWAIKRSLYRDFMESENMEWDDPVLQSLDLEYHNLNPERGLYTALQSQEGIVNLIPRDRVENAIQCPPKDTRAAIRGQMVQLYKDRIRKVHWTGVEFNDGDVLDLTDIITQNDVELKLQSSKEQFA